ncbi:inositol monophosphatase 1 [Battus philenor]|uniref:inositol monophosphatase 1 n=1 Tax=Battus philenor TaxID=42288 RepID=UPI0035CEC054
MNKMKNNIDDYFEVAVELVKSAGEFIKQHTSGCKSYEVKSCDIDLVTEVDKKVEQFLIEGLSKQFPTHKFVGEEAVADGAKVEFTDDPTWFIDPVDGTMNFIHGFPYSCISVGLHVEKEPVIGIVYNPIVDKLYTAKSGQGAFLNGQPIHVSKVNELRNALVGFETGTSRDEEKKEVVLENFKLMVKHAHGIRAVGSAALNMALVAEGKLDAYFEFGIHAWDIAAGIVIVREAGGVCVDPTNAPLHTLRRKVLCTASPDLAQEIASIIKQYTPESD